MVLSPIDIHNKEFTRGFRGFNEDEVNDYLDQVIKDYELALRTNKDMEKEITELNERIEHFISIEDSLNKSLVIAQETAEELKANAQKEAKLIIKEAEKNADRIINDALSESRKIAIASEEVRKQTKVFRTRLKMLIEAQLDMINSNDWEDFLQMMNESSEEEVEVETE
ncbi:MAG TPA: DivIVA domain-containing protein [Pseudogracilibacillus sp.]|nr:DivIVA domain-containing protein [Pseudogracilibacillus sp.]